MLYEYLKPGVWADIIYGYYIIHIIYHSNFWEQTKCSNVHVLNHSKELHFMKMILITAKFLECVQRVIMNFMEL